MYYFVRDVRFFSHKHRNKNVIDDSVQVITRTCVIILQGLLTITHICVDVKIHKIAHIRYGKFWVFISIDVNARRRLHDLIWKVFVTWHVSWVGYLNSNSHKLNNLKHDMDRHRQPVEIRM